MIGPYIHHRCSWRSSHLPEWRGGTPFVYSPGHRHRVGSTGSHGRCIRISNQTLFRAPRRRSGIFLVGCLPRTGYETDENSSVPDTVRRALPGRSSQSCAVGI